LSLLYIEIEKLIIYYLQIGIDIELLFEHHLSIKEQKDDQVEKYSFVVGSKKKMVLLDKFYLLR
jgi:hypothetical protein